MIKKRMARFVLNFYWWIALTIFAVFLWPMAVVAAIALWLVETAGTPEDNIGIYTFVYSIVPGLAACITWWLLLESLLSKGA
jgi:hypothetical protein